MSNLTVEQLAEQERETMSRCNRRLKRIARLQAALSVRQQVARMMHEQASERLWLLENGYTLKHRLADFTEHDAARVTATLLAFDPLRITTKSRKR